LKDDTGFGLEVNPRIHCVTGPFTQNALLTDFPVTDANLVMVIETQKSPEFFMLGCCCQQPSRQDSAACVSLPSNSIVKEQPRRLLVPALSRRHLWQRVVDRFFRR